MGRDKYLVAAFYKFISLLDYESHKSPLESISRKAGTVGTILLAHEGVNGTISGSQKGVSDVLKYLSQKEVFGVLNTKFSFSNKKAFKRMKVRIKNEIVSLGKPDIEPLKKTGEFVDPEFWNKIASDPEIILLDTRNIYEHSIGTFKGALLADTKSFREFPEWAEKNLKNMKKKKIAMFCTGGIRCEKASSYLIDKGYENVLQLKGGILKYLEVADSNMSLWNGECFVFDDRVSIKHGLQEGSFDMCHACRMPVSDEDKKSSNYIQGVRCDKCYRLHPQESKIRFAERQKQIQLANQRNTIHLGQKFN